MSPPDQQLDHDQQGSDSHDSSNIRSVSVSDTEDTLRAPVFPKLSTNILDFPTLCRPQDIPLPSLPTEPPFVCEDGWMDDIMATMKTFYHGHDDESLDKIPPMAMVRCRRGGKTRATLEIAHEFRRRHEDAAVFHVSLAHDTPLQQHGVNDLVRAILERIVVQATPDYMAADDNQSAFATFCSQHSEIDPQTFAKWLGNVPSLMIVDDIDKAYTQMGLPTEAACALGDFLQSHFLTPKKRYLILASSTLHAIHQLQSSHGQFMGRKLNVIWKALPYAERMDDVNRIDRWLQSAREALHSGFIPGMINELQWRDRKQKYDVFVQECVQQYNTVVSVNPLQAFQNLLLSFITGEPALVPWPLHPLLDTYPAVEPEGCKVLWIPYAFHKIMSHIWVTEAWPNVVRNNLKTLSERLFNCVGGNRVGIRWEEAFVCVLLLRCGAHCPDDYLLPKNWFDKTERLQVTFNFPFTGRLIRCKDGRVRRLLLSEIKSWKELKDDMEAGVKALTEPTIAIMYPPTVEFQPYHAFAIHCENGKIVEARGFRMDVELMPTKRALSTSDVKTSFYLSGFPPPDDKRRRGWKVAGEPAIANFLGMSGRFWTPAHWQRFVEGVAWEPPPKRCWPFCTAK